MAATPQFCFIQELEQTARITIGLNRAAANSFLSRRSRVHGLLNWIPLVLSVISLCGFIWVSWMLGILAVLAAIASAPIIQGHAVSAIRILLLQDEDLFDLFWEAGWTTIRVNADSRTIRHPSEWRKFTEELRSQA